MVKESEVKIKGKGKRVGIICSRFNEFITTQLLRGAIDTLLRHEVEEENIEVVWVPGSFEIPFIAKRMAFSKKYDVVISLGAIIRGSTPHFEYIASEVIKGVAQINLESEIPVILGILTTDNIEQAVERAGTKSGNKGRDAALTALEMAGLAQEFKI
jgi:6,7-dimethyl-8-ribityllumazine synthase